MSKVKIKDKEEIVYDVCDLILDALIPEDSKRLDMSYIMIEDTETNYTHHFDRFKNKEVKIKINPDHFWNYLYKMIDAALDELEED